MLINAIGQVLPAAMAVTLSPFPIIAIVLLLSTPRARANGLAFTLGWVVGLAALTTAALLVSEGTEATDGTSAAWIDWLRVAVGALMIVLALRKWVNRPRPGDEVPMPGWMKSFETSTPRRSLLLGLALSAANVKNVALAGSAAASITDMVAEGHDAVLGAVVFVLLGSASVISAVVFHLVGGDRAKGPLERVKEFMLVNNSVIMMVILLLLGANILGNGLAAVGP